VLCKQSLKILVFQTVREVTRIDIHHT